MRDIELLCAAKDSETLATLIVYRVQATGQIEVGLTSVPGVFLEDRAVPGANPGAFEHTFKETFTHYKGGKYGLLYYARRALTHEEVVVYQNRADRMLIWVRPREMFFGNLEDGRRRFTPDEGDALG